MQHEIAGTGLRVKRFAHKVHHEADENQKEGRERLQVDRSPHRAKAPHSDERQLSEAPRFSADVVDFPALQLKHFVLSLLEAYFPGAQREHPSLLLLEAYFPGAQREHSVLALLEACCPGSQFMHAVPEALCVSYIPAGHAVQPDPSLYMPALQPDSLLELEALSQSVVL